MITEDYSPFCFTLALYSSMNVVDVNPSAEPLLSSNAACIVDTKMFYPLCFFSNRYDSTNTNDINSHNNANDIINHYSHNYTIMCETKTEFPNPFLSTGFISKTNDPIVYSINLLSLLCQYSYHITKKMI